MIHDIDRGILFRAVNKWGTGLAAEVVHLGVL